MVTNMHDCQLGMSIGADKDRLLSNSRLAQVVFLRKSPPSWWAQEPHFN